MQVLSVNRKVFSQGCDRQFFVIDHGAIAVDKRTQNVYVLAGEEIEIVIYPDGEWIFV